MADRTISERLQPSLLDRLTDLDPGDQREARDDRVIDIRRLRDIIERDLSWLLNTGNAERTIDMQRYPHAAKSVLNYGVQDVSGGFSTATRAEELRASIQRAVTVFEPRIHAGTLTVNVLANSAAAGATVMFDIHADMWAQPMPMELYLRSAVDLTTGNVVVERLS